MNCICKKDFQPDYLQVNGLGTLNSPSRYGINTNTTPYIITQGLECSVSIRPMGGYIVSLVVGEKTLESEMTRDCFLEFFSMRTFIRNKKLESLGL
jgi:hypothetical protein